MSYDMLYEENSRTPVFSFDQKRPDRCVKNCVIHPRVAVFLVSRWICLSSVCAYVWSCQNTVRVDDEG